MCCASIFTSISFAWYKVCLFSILLNAQIAETEYLQGICWPIYVVEEFSRLLAHPIIFN